MLTVLLHKVWDRVLAKDRMHCNLQRIKKITDSYHLTKEQEAAVRKYFAVCGKVNLTSHNFYLEKTGKFCVNYLPEDLHYGYIDPFYNNWRESVIIDNKCNYPQLFKDIRQPENFAMRNNSIWFGIDGQPATLQEVEKQLASEPEIVVKMAIGSCGGKGVFFVKGSELSQVIGQIRDDILVQKPLAQHERLSAVNPSSINTIRMISLLSQSGTKVYSTVLRIGIAGSRVDNASSGGITCGITEDGRLKKYAYKVTGERFEAHPDTGLVFENYEIPGYQKCLEAVSRLSVQIPHFRLVSWDFSIDQSGEPVLIEANLHYGQLDFHQLNNGPLFGEDTPKILEEVFGKK